MTTEEVFRVEQVAELTADCVSYALRRCQGGVPALREVNYGGGHTFQVQAASGEWFLISVERGPQ